MIVLPTKRRRFPPGPRGTLLLGNLPAMRRGALALLQSAARDYGDVVRLPIGPPLLRRYFHLVNHPDGIKHVLQFNHRNYKKSRAYTKLGALVGKGLLTSEGELWVRQRRLAQPSFHKDRLAGLVGIMADGAERAARRLEPLVGRPLDLSREMMHTALDIVASTLLGTDLSDQVDTIGAALTFASEHVLHRTRSILDLPLPTPRHRRFQEAVASLDRIVDGVLQSRRQRGGPRDLLGMLMEATDEETGRRMDDRQLHDEVMTFLLAGHETTATALTWTFRLLAEHPDAERRLHHEVDSVLGGRAPTIDDLPRLAYARMVFEESMRLYPPAWAMGRLAIGDDVVMGYDFPAGSLVAIAPYLIHRHPEFWPDPERFDPERFSPQAVRARVPFSYIPFGAGPRQCIGNHFAMQEGIVVLARIAAQFRLALVPGRTIELEPNVTLRPKEGLWMTASLR